MDLPNYSVTYGQSPSTLEWLSMPDQNSGLHELFGLLHPGDRGALEVKLAEKNHVL